MTPFMCHSQPTQCAYIGLWRGGAAPSTPARRFGAPRRFRPRGRCGRRQVACGPDMTVRRFATTRPLGSDATPPSTSASRAERGSFACATALRVTSRLPRRTVAVAAGRRRPARVRTGTTKRPCQPCSPPTRPRRTHQPLRHRSQRTGRSRTPRAQRREHHIGARGKNRGRR